VRELLIVMQTSPAAHCGKTYRGPRKTPSGKGCAGFVA
jgi:hypothetical protein